MILNQGSSAIYCYVIAFVLPLFWKQTACDSTDDNTYKVVASYLLGRFQISFGIKLVFLKLILK